MWMSKCKGIDAYYNGNLAIVGFSPGFYSPWVISVFQVLCVIYSGSRVDKWSLQLNPSVFVSVFALSLTLHPGHIQTILE